jgi:hypothetical protein
MSWTEPTTNRSKSNKGYFNIEVINRIESNCEYLEEQLNSYGYTISIITKTDWETSDFPYLTEINRIRDNVNALLEAYYTQDDSPDITYWNSLNWEDANSLEENLKNIYDLLELMAENFKYAGTFYAGQEVIL